MSSQTQTRCEWDVVLRDGATIHVRPFAATDSDAASSSQASRYLARRGDSNWAGQKALEGGMKSRSSFPSIISVSGSSMRKLRRMPS